PTTISTTACSGPTPRAMAAPTPRSDRRTAMTAVTVAAGRDAAAPLVAAVPARGAAGAAVPAGAAGAAAGAGPGGGRAPGLTDWPIERIAQAVEPNDAQRAVLDELKAATAQALDILKAACPTALPSTPTGRIEAMHQRLDAMLQAVRTVRPV